MAKVKSQWGWLKALFEITLHNQVHWWVIPASLLLFGIVTAVQIVPYQTTNTSPGTGSLIFLGNSNLRYYILNPIYLFVASNLGSYYQHEETVLYRIGSRWRLWLGKAIVFVAVTMAYLGAIILFVEIATIPFINYIGDGWSKTVLAYYGGELFFSKDNSPLIVWSSTIWFVFLSWLALGGLAFVVSQLTGRAGAGFFTAVSLNFAGLILNLVAIPPEVIQIFDISRPMLFFWYGEPMPSFQAAMAYWVGWYIILMGVTVWHINRLGGMIRIWLSLWAHSTWLIIQMSVGWLWLVIILFALLSPLINIQTISETEITALNSLGARLAPIISFVGPSLESPFFSLIFLRWILIFLIFLLIVGETTTRSLWRQHVMLLPRLGGRQFWWLSHITAVLLISLLYLLIYLAPTWFTHQNNLQTYASLFHLQIFALYWFNLALLGCSQLLLLLYTHSRNQTLLIMVAFLVIMWIASQNNPSLLPWLPITQTAILAQLLSKGTINTAGLALWGASLFIFCALIGAVTIKRYQFPGSLSHN